MTSICVLCPVLGRPDALRPLVESIAASTSEPWSVLFLTSPDDEQAALVARSLAMDYPQVAVREAPWELGPGDFARKTNLGFRETTGEYVFAGASDLRFHPGWDLAALRVADMGCDVVGVRDGWNPAVERGRHATHVLVRRSYVAEHGLTFEGEPGVVYAECYDHQSVDLELVAVAMARGVWGFAQDALVEHLHPFAHKAEMDATYEKALAKGRADRILFQRRYQGWRRELRRRRRAAA